MFSTQVLPQLQSSDDSEEESSPETVGLIIVGDKEFEVKRGETKIGRDSSMCSIVIEDFTVSKVHAIIESDGVDDTFIYDVGSTNQTRLKKKILKPHCRYKLDNESKLVFGNVTARFILPSNKSSSVDIKPKLPNLVNLNSVEELDDIFDVATQVEAQSISSRKTLVFEKHEQNSQIFKNPNSVVCAKMGKSFESLGNCFDEVTQCKLNYEEETQRTVPHNSAFKKSDIFSIKTQCQLYETPVAENNKFEAKTIGCNDSHNDCESDKVKTLLNDGEDDVLSTFMSLHSPVAKSNDNSLMNVKVKSEVINLSQVLDAPTQVQTNIIQESCAKYETEVGNLKMERDLSVDYSSRSSCKPSNTGTPLNKRSKIVASDDTCENSDRFTEHLKEDIIMTQEFKVENLTSGKKYESVSHDLDCHSQNENQFHFEETVDNFSTKDNENFNEDLILTQSFEDFKKIHQTKETKKVIPESEDLSEVDFMGTQFNIFEKESQRAKETTSKKRSLPSPGSCNSDAETQLDETVDFTQRDDENDFISTQIFEETSKIRKENDNSRKDDNYDEDFISTQPVELSLIKAKRSPQEGTGDVKTFCKESSPDLLGLEDTWNNLEDSIATQKFEIPECQNHKKNCSEFTSQTDSDFSSLIGTQKFLQTENCNIELTKAPKIVESSGDETESDLEILFDNIEKGKDRKLLDRVSKSFKAEPKLENSTQSEKAVTPESDSNSSYVFELNPENNLEDDVISIEPNKRLEAEKSDSDATDCEELAVIFQERKADLLSKTEIEKNQMSSTVPHDLEKETTSCSNEGLMTDNKIYKIENERENSPLSPLSLEMPSTQEVETSIGNLLRNKSEENKDFQSPLKSSSSSSSEVGIKNLNQSSTTKQIDFSEKPNDSVLKRPLDSNTADAVPLKKPKNEILNEGFLKSSDKQFSKLVKAHDVAQIQPCRTRNSMKALTTGNNLNETDVSLRSNITNERPTSRRKSNRKRKSIKKSNGDITPYLTTRKVESRRSYYADRKKETSSEENKMELKPVEGNIRILRSSRKNSGISVTPLLMESPTGIRRSKRRSRTKSWEFSSNPCVNIVFTGFECESLDNVIGILGGKKTDDLSFCEVVVANKVRRTVKFLCAIGLCLPITSPQWLITCKKENKFLNPWDFILKDEESERKWDFELRTSLERSRKMNLLQGYNIFATENTKPPQKDMLAIVESCGGTPLSTPPNVWPKNTIIVTCLEDKQRWPLAKSKNVKIVHYEFILSGVLKQKLDFKTYRLQ